MEKGKYLGRKKSRCGRNLKGTRKKTLKTEKRREGREEKTALAGSISKKKSQRRKNRRISRKKKPSPGRTCWGEGRCPKEKSSMVLGEEKNEKGCPEGLVCCKTSRIDKRQKRNVVPSLWAREEERERPLKKLRFLYAFIRVWGAQKKGSWSAYSVVHSGKDAVGIRKKKE